MNRLLIICKACALTWLLAVGCVSAANWSDNPMKTSLGMPLAKSGLAGGVVHKLPDDLRGALIANDEASRLWESLTPLARNEWICWVENAKKSETRSMRLARVCDDLKAGKRRPCCWPGCSHRVKSGK